MSNESREARLCRLEQLMREALALADELDLSVVALELDSAWVKLHPDAPRVSECETLEEANALRVTCPPVSSSILR